MSRIQENKGLVNGVDVARLKETIQALGDDPTLGEFVFRARNEWLGCGHGRTKIKDFYGAGQEDDQTRGEPFVFDNDEPPVLAGHDRGANPVEYLLTALAGCLTTTMVFHAASRGIEIQHVDSTLEGEIDVRGFLGLDENVPKGFKKITVTFRVRSDADAAKLQQLAEFSPVFNTVTRPTPVEVKIEKV